MSLASSSSYTFETAVGADKNSIAKAIEDQFGVSVLSVKTMIIKGKTKHTGKKRTLVHLGNKKKAIVKIKPDQKISIFEEKTS